jgi:Ca2+-binding RTX toxin-like protein
MAQFPANIDLSSLDGSTGFKLSGTATSHYSGRSVASAGDVNGDGFADVIVGASGANASYVVFGQASGFAANIDLSSLDGTTGFRLSGAGFSVNPAGDVNGDGFADMIVGDSASYVVFGRASGFAANINLGSLDGSTGFSLTGTGNSVASAGDVNGDGFADVIVGSGAAQYVVFGKASGFAANINLAALDGITGFTLTGAGAIQGSGARFVNSAGDINGDGFADVIIGADLASVNGTNSGASYVVFGKASGFAANIDLATLDGTSGFRLSGAAAGNRSGFSVASAGDVNGDGVADVIVGALGANASYVLFGHASGFAANINLGSLDGTTGFRLSGGAAAGVAVDSAGDVNGDGFADVIVGASSVNGAVGASYVLFGKASGFAANIDLLTLDGTTGFKLSGEVAGDSGRSVASAGDVNGDGFADLIVGAPFADPHGNSSGVSYVIFAKLPDAAVNRAGTDASQTLAGGDFADTLSGLGGDDVLHGNGGDDTLIGGAGGDTIIGGSGTDTASYALSAAGVTVNLGAGTASGGDAAGDTLSGIENLIGSAQADTLTGDGNDNVLEGGAGGDTLDGGGGSDTASYASSVAGVTVNLGAGTASGGDAAGDTLSGIENLIGSAQADTLTGDGGNNRLDGNAGDDTLIGGAGGDTLIGGLGSDTASYAGSAAGVTVSLATGTGSGGDAAGDTLSGIENLVGSAQADTLTGDGGDNVLEGGAGGDTLIGALGSDTASYALSAAGVTVNLGAGTASGGDAAGDTLSGIENLIGSAQADSLTGDGNDNTLDGGGGADALTGGAGNDTYIVDHADDVVTELAAQGTDTVQSSIDYTLGANLENLTLTGSAFIGFGNDDANVITGSAGINVLVGLGGDDTIDSGGGRDAMVGGLGNDTYIVRSGGEGIYENANEGIDTVLSSAHYRLPANVENLTLQGSADLQAYGNSDANTLTGNAGNNILDGDAGADTMIGGAGNDVYLVDNGSDQVIENAGEGNDAVFSSVHFVLPADVETLVLQGSADLQGYGNGGVNALFGNSGSNLLDGRGGADYMAGGAGDDVYFVDDGGDAVIENAGEGRDAIFSTTHLVLSANVEVLVLQGSADLQGYGNGDANKLYGNTGSNLLDGRGGADFMMGGAGNDVYFVDDAGDMVRENSGQGTDAVFATIDYALTAEVETLVLQGSGNLSGTGNGLANKLYGNAGGNTLDGGAAADVLMGNAGNDTFVFHAGEAAGDIVGDFAGNGAAAGDSLQFVGFGTALQGATFSQVGVSNQWLIHSGLVGGTDETITLLNGASVDPTDVSFL